LPEDTIRDAALEGRRYYEDWAKKGYLTATPGNVVDYDFIRAEINALSKVFKIGEIGYDPYNATQMSNDLLADGFNLVKVQQGFLSSAR
jgi:phage terminase large subunit-like protein